MRGIFLAFFCYSTARAVKGHAKCGHSSHRVGHPKRVLSSTVSNYSTIPPAIGRVWFLLLTPFGELLSAWGAVFAYLCDAACCKRIMFNVSINIAISNGCLENFLWWLYSNGNSKKRNRHCLNHNSMPLEFMNKRGLFDRKLTMLAFCNPRGATVACASRDLLLQALLIKQV